jgi:hypothetical protein
MSAKLHASEIGDLESFFRVRFLDTTRPHCPMWSDVAMSIPSDGIVDPHPSSVLCRHRICTCNGAIIACTSFLSTHRPTDRLANTCTQRPSPPILGILQDDSAGARTRNTPNGEIFLPVVMMQMACAQKNTALPPYSTRSGSGYPLVSAAARQPNFGADLTKSFWGPDHGSAKDLLMETSPRTFQTL